MATRMSELNGVLAAVPVWMLTREGKPTLIDGAKNTTGQDIMLLFSTPEKALIYAARYPSLKTAEAEQTTIHQLVKFFDGRVDYYILDRPA